MASQKRARVQKGKPRKLKLPENAGLDERLVDRYAKAGIDILSDDIPRRLDPSLRTELRPIVGDDVGDIRIHTGERGHRMAEALGARAFAAGEKDIYFAKDEFQPGTIQDRAILAHELTHVAEGNVGLMRERHKKEHQASEMGARRAEERVYAEEKDKKARPKSTMQEEQRVDVEELIKQEQLSQEGSMILAQSVSQSGGLVSCSNGPDRFFWRHIDTDSGNRRGIGATREFAFIFKGRTSR